MLQIRSSFLKTVVPLFETKRLRSKINIQKPRAPHFEKALFLEVTKPKLINPNKLKSAIELCDKDFNPYKKDTDYNPYQRIIANELQKHFQNSSLVGFFHVNSISTTQKFKAFAAYKKKDMYFRDYGKGLMEMTVKGTPYEPVLELCVSHNAIVFSSKPQIKELLNIAKKIPELVFMAAIYEGKFMCKDEILEYSLIPDIQTAQAMLVQTLNSIGNQLVGQFTTHQNELVNNLQSRIKQLEEA